MRLSKPGFHAIKIIVGACAAAALIAGMTQAASSRSPVSTRLTGTGPSTPSWTVAWGTGVQAPVAGDDDSGPNWSTTGFAQQSLRQVVRAGVGGTHLRIRLTNAYGTRPLHVAGVTVARSAGGALAWPGTFVPVTFGRSPRAVVQPGRELLSDAVAMPTSPLERLALTMRFTGATGPATFHRFALTKSYRAPGDHLTDVGQGGFAESTGSWYFLGGLEVTGRPPGAAAVSGRRTVIVFGDSLVDGVGSTMDADARFTDDLQERLDAAGRPLGVLNAGIGTNKLLRDSACGGRSGLSRFRRDVLDRPGVRSVIVHLGANDIGAPQSDDPCVRPNPKVTAQELIEGHRKLIQAAHAAGVRAIGMTVGPMKGALFPMWSPEGEKVRQALNLWIRTSREYDAVIDSDRAMAGSADPRLPRQGYVFMDGLHPNDAGYHAIARAIDLAAL
ncbi:SGNH/GDSL hydrolase family protein [Actinomadura roseirufa]|uniref:SGNH/GDSL hydrolase family protein n=1 Tax=Actinomadura roseirufa TaxID=2094049 RepID=UPI001A9559AC|nr:SGNH/GDSL hydrolase family protein [Actinomadura roseirufa]